MIGKQNPLILAKVKWTGFRGSGDPYEPHRGLRPQSRFLSITEFDGIQGSRDMVVQEAIEYDPKTRQSVVAFSMSPRAPVQFLFTGAQFALWDGRKEIAKGEILSIELPSD